MFAQQVAAAMSSGDVALIWITFFGVAGLIVLAVVFACFRAVRGDQKIKLEEVKLKLKTQEVRELEARNVKAEIQLRSYHPTEFTD